MPTLNYIKKAFPDTKITAIFGNSVDTVKKYSEDAADRAGFDMCHLDGGHTEDIFSKDYANIKTLVKSGIVIFDDYDYGEIRNFIDKKLEKGEIIKYVDNTIINNNLHFIYKYF